MLAIPPRWFLVALSMSHHPAVAASWVLFKLDAGFQGPLTLLKRMIWNHTSWTRRRWAGQGKHLREF